MIVWIDGAFGVGKTTTAQLIVGRSIKWRLFDPEDVGHMLVANLKDLDFADFQDLAPWRSLVPRVAHEISTLTGESLLIVQTVLVAEHWDELQRGFAGVGRNVFHVVLDAGPDTLRSRITSDRVHRDAEGWRLDHIRTFESARPWMTTCADLVIDTSGLQAEQCASQILGALK